MARHSAIFEPWLKIRFDKSRAADGSEILTRSNWARLRIIARAPKHLDSHCQDSSSQEDPPTRHIMFNLSSSSTFTLRIHFQS